MGRLRELLIAGTSLSLLSVVVGGQSNSDAVPPPDCAPIPSDEPVWHEPPPLPVSKLSKIKIDDSYDRLEKTLLEPARPGREGPPPAAAVNTLGEVPDSAWYTNRHARNRMTIEELVRGPHAAGPPQGSQWTILSAKSEGVTPGFLVRDSAGRKYLLKFDIPSAPNGTTAVDVIGSKMFYALGYNTPENYIVFFSRDQLTIADNAVVTQLNGAHRKMKPYDVDKLLPHSLQRSDGMYRAMASLWIQGEVLGPWQYWGTRPDDPNDIYPHQDRRDLRGLYVFSAWLNHYDTTALNTLDVAVDEHGARFVRHYLIDFGSILGNSGSGPRDPRNGYVSVYDFDFAWKEALSFGIYAPKWQRVRFPNMPEVGRFEGDAFDPLTWKSVYPNPAFDNRRPDDIYWAAKQLMAFSSEEIRKIVETSEYDDRRTVDYLTHVLIQRRDKIVHAAFSLVLPLDNFVVRNGELVFDDLAAKYGLRHPLRLSSHWFTCNPGSGRAKALIGADLKIPLEMQTVAPGSVIGIRLRDLQQSARAVDVFLRGNGEGRWDVVQIHRTIVKG